MMTLPQTFAPVQPSWQQIAIVALPERCPSEPEPFHPSAKDEAWDMGYRLGRDGESADYPGPVSLHRDLAQSFSLGNRAGRKAREAAEARELGRALGLSGSGISEPAKGYWPESAAAYREGYAEGLAEFEDDRETEAWIAIEEADRLEEALSTAITDRDVYPMGCMS